MPDAGADVERQRIVDAADAAQHAATALSSQQAASEVWAATVEAAIEQEMSNLMEQERQETAAEAPLAAAPATAADKENKEKGAGKKSASGKK